ncbi:MAG TPA: archaellar assembly protein FlaJ [Methanoregulaceae archaeon]|nr:archaellar assembly protein FlaJ [Methanoregulaceae archaeon]HQJ87710.1 archaellar assembly protein FlaJ [Methanoregulaceae archaeon]
MVLFETVTDRILTRVQGEGLIGQVYRTFQERYIQLVESKKLSADLLFMITYMTSLALARATRPEIFGSASQREEYLSSRYIAKVNNLVVRWNYSYKEALEVTADRSKNEMVQNLLNRFSNSIDAGVPDDEFLANELETTRNVYRSSIEQGFELLRKWGDAYIAMLLSGTVIAVTIMISIAIYAPEGIDNTLNVSYLLILGISIFGITLMYQSVPDDPKTHGLDTWLSREQGLIYRLERVLVPLVVIVSLLLWLLGVNAGVICLFAGLMLAPLGLLGFIDDANITLRDADFSVFIRSLGAVIQGQGATMVHALGQVDKKSLVALDPLIRSVYSKMNLGLEEDAIWERFIGESGSNLIYKFLNIFRDTVSMGGPAGDIGKVVGLSMLEMVLLREKKDMFSRSFIVLLVPMHAAMIAIFVSLYNIMAVLTTAVAEMMTQFQQAAASAGSGSGDMNSMAGNAFLSGSLNMFVNFPKEQMTTYVVVIMLILTVANVIAARIVGGGDRYMYYFYSTLFFSLSGIIYLLVPIAVGVFFSVDVLTQIAQAGATGG